MDEGEDSHSKSSSLDRRHVLRSVSLERSSKNSSNGALRGDKRTVNSSEITNTARLTSAVDADLGILGMIPKRPSKESQTSRSAQPVHYFSESSSFARSLQIPQVCNYSDLFCESGEYCFLDQCYDCSNPVTDRASALYPDGSINCRSYFSSANNADRQAACILTCGQGPPTSSPTSAPTEEGCQSIQFLGICFDFFFAILFQFL